MKVTKPKGRVYSQTIAITGLYDIASKDLSPYLPGYLVGIGMKWNLFEGMSQQKKNRGARLSENAGRGLLAKSFFRHPFRNQQALPGVEHVPRTAPDAGCSDGPGQRIFQGTQQGIQRRGWLPPRKWQMPHSFWQKARIGQASGPCMATMYRLSRLLYFAGMTDQYISYMRRAKANP